MGLGEKLLDRRGDLGLIRWVTVTWPAQRSCRYHLDDVTAHGERAPWHTTKI